MSESSDGGKNYFLFVIIAIIIISIIFIIIVSLTIWGTSKTIQKGNVAQSELIIPPPTPVGFGYQCSNYECDNDLVCDSVSQTCKLSVGSICDDGSQCVNGSYCSGICLIQDPAYITNTSLDPCPCNDDMSCISTLDGTNRRLCKLKQDNPCVNNNQCISDRCQNGLCTTGQTPGAPCTLSTECSEGNQCSNGFCQPDGIKTGFPGASCDLQSANGPKCNSGSSCVNNICVSSTLGNQGSCNVTTLTCALPQQCVQFSDYSPCTENSQGGCVCLYPYTQRGLYRPDPNSCRTGTCYGSARCNTSSVCIVPSLYPCSADSQCELGLTCSSNGAVYRILYSYYDSNNNTQQSFDPIFSLNSYTIDYVPFSTYVPKYKVNSIIGYSGILNANNDKIYYVITGDIQNPQDTGLIDTDGKVLIKGYDSQETVNNSQTTVDEKIFLDASIFSSTDYYLLFREIITVKDSTGSIISTQSNKTVYRFNPSNAFTEPYNVTEGTGIDGTQYQTNGTPIDAVLISVSENEDVMLSDNNNITVKSKNDNYYLLLIRSDSSGTPISVNSMSVPKYYSSNLATSVDSMTCSANCPSYINISYIDNFRVSFGNNNYNTGNVVTFNGNARGAIFPIFEWYNSEGIESVSNYQVYDYDIFTDSRIGFSASYSLSIATDISTNILGLYVTLAGISSSYPGNFTQNSRVLSLRTGSYVYATGSCS